MPAEVIWDNPEKNILRQIYIDPWTADDWINITYASNKMMDTVDYPVDIIIDGSQVKRIPAKILHAIGKTSLMIHPRQRYSVAIASSTFAHNMFELVKKIRPKAVEHTELVSTLNEAYAILDKKREI